ncbi:hypothetical protein BDZ89DRAFT_1128184 [Hymenopellis radicata]|nr:hypothetical protein BDZ89DRAFT_1128184 [Hymenopellis radicata]
MVNFASVFIAVSLAVLAAAQSPSLLLTSHPDAVMLGSDPDSNWTVAYDRDFKEVARMYTPFENRTTAAPAPAALGGKCRGLSVDELKRLPAWTAMAQYIRTTWGGGSYNLWTAWDGATEAWMCVGDDVVDLQATGSPGCTINTVSTGGILVGTNGSVTIGVTSGYISSSDYTVTKSSTIGISYTATLTVGVPDLISGSGSWTASAQFTNQDQYSFKTEINNQVQQSVTLNAPSGSTCSLTYESKTCHETVKGRVPYTGSGWLRVGFNERTQGHYYWHVLIDNQPYNTRTSYSEFTGSVNAHSKSRYSGHCT